MTPSAKKTSTVEAGTRRFFLPALTAGMVLFTLAAAVLVFKRTRPSAPSVDSSANVAEPKTSSKPATQLERRSKLVTPPVAPPPSSAETPVPPPVQPAPAPGRATDPNDPAHRLLSSLVKLDLKSGAISREQTGIFQQAFKLLAQMGPAAIPAIRDFLERNEDINFRGLQGGESIGQPSLRTALFDVLGKIGGPEAEALSAAMLRTTSVPLEVAVLARTLEQMAPGQYRELELSSARTLLARANDDQWKGGDTAALFEVLQNLGDASVVPDLVKAVAKWKYYATVSLAGLPEGAGIPALIDLARDPRTGPAGRADTALRVLAQVSLENADARSALIEQARAGRISDAAWPAVVSSLSGNPLQFGGQVFGSAAPAASSSDEQIQQRLALIDQVIAATTNPTAKQLLQNSRATIAQRLHH